MTGGELNSILLLAIALANCLQAYFYMRTHRAIETLEINTNSIKDALVATTAKASEAKGRAEERAAGDARAKTLLEKNKDA